MFRILLFLLYAYIVQSSYLDNKEATINYMDIPKVGLFSDYNYPSIGFSCSLKDNQDNLYFVSSSQHSIYLRSQSENYKCSRTKKKVQIMKFNKTNNSLIDYIIQNDVSDYVVSCGIDKYSNTLYYVSGNYYNCPSLYNTDSSLTRINLDLFAIKDNTKLRDIPNVPTFSSHSYWNYKYIDTPTTSINIDGNSLWLGFGNYYTGIWRLNITSPQIKLMDFYQKTYYEIQENYEGLNSNNMINYRFQQIKKSFKLNNSIYFIDDSGYKDAKIMRINVTDFVSNKTLRLNENNTDLITLDGISGISSIEVDYFREKIYVIMGILSSELYQYDFNFNKIFLSKSCNIDFLKFPTEWGIITKLVIDEKTGSMYALISTKHNYFGIVKIRTKDLSIDIDSYKKFSEIYNYTYTDYRTNEIKTNSYLMQYPNMNITNLINKEGKLYILPYADYNQKKIIEIQLFGCSKGFGISNKINDNTCNICKPGTFSDVIGGTCKDCIAGYSINNYESYLCNKCEAGKYTNALNNINCLNCLAGKYVETEGANSCIDCDKGKYSIIAASKKR